MAAVSESDSAGALAFASFSAFRAASFS
eukprot:SAG11_NODE_15447_length_578_cov_0.718163_1_plen_27_part_01